MTKTYRALKEPELVLLIVSMTSCDAPIAREIVDTGEKIKGISFVAANEQQGGLENTGYLPQNKRIEEVVKGYYTKPD